MPSDVHMGRDVVSKQRSDVTEDGGLPGHFYVQCNLQHLLLHHFFVKLARGATMLTDT